MDFPKKKTRFFWGGDPQLQIWDPGFFVSVGPTQVDVYDHEDVPRRWQMIVAVMFRKMRIMPSSP